jgi:hypothetical protein
MNNTCPNPGCGAVYNISPDHVGRRFICKKCAAPLVVTDYGLQVEGGPVAAEGVSSPAPMPNMGGPPMPAYRSGPGGPNPLANVLNYVRGIEVSTWLFGFGAFIVLVYLFFPLIDTASVQRQEAVVVDGELKFKHKEAEIDRKMRAIDREMSELKDKEDKISRQQADLDRKSFRDQEKVRREQNELNDKEFKDPDRFKKENQEEYNRKRKELNDRLRTLQEESAKKRKELSEKLIDQQEANASKTNELRDKLSDLRREKGKLSDEWDAERHTLEPPVEAAEIGRRRNSYWYGYFTLLGCVLLAFGSLGYIHPSQPMGRRILGSIVLVALLLGVFNTFAGFGLRLSIGR